MARAVITGYGVVSPYGIGTDAMINGIINNTNCFINQNVYVRDNSEPVVLPTGRVPLTGEESAIIPDKYSRIMPPMSLFAYLAYEEARNRAFLTDADMVNAGIYIASTMSHVHNSSKQLASDIFKTFNNNPAFLLAEIIGCNNRIVAPCAACATGLQAVNLAVEAIEAGKLDIAICGATEEWSNDLAKIFIKLGIASKTECRPFAEDRDGTVISEGAGIIILESEEHAKKRLVRHYGYVYGTGYSFSENPHVPTVESITRCMINSFSSFYINEPKWMSTEIDIYAHATGTVIGDAVEAEAIEQFKKRTGIIVNRKYLKNHLGHTMAASGVIELIYSLYHVQPLPTIHNAFGLGGVNASTFIVPKAYIGD